jgi:hypothetical protein
MLRRTQTWIGTLSLSLGGLVLFGGCGYTNLQLQDYAVTAVFGAVAQTLVGLVTSAILGGQAT